MCLVEIRKGDSYILDVLRSCAIAIVNLIFGAAPLSEHSELVGLPRAHAAETARRVDEAPVEARPGDRED